MSTEIELFKKRFNDTMYEYKFDAETISKQTGIHISTIYRYINGDIKDLKMSNIFKLATCLNVSPIWLAGWSDEKFNMPTQTSNVFPLIDKPIKLPIIGKISAGLPLLAVENIEGYEFAPSSYIKQNYEYFYLKVEGDSMNIKFNENDIVLIQKQDYLNNGEIGVILVNGDDATIKKFQQKGDFVFLEPMSTNPTHQVQIYNLKETKVNIIGKAVSYQGKLN